MKILTISLTQIKLHLPKFITVLFKSSCVKNNRNKIHKSTDLLLQTRTDKVIQFLDFIGIDNNFSQEEKMHSEWNKAKSLQML